MYAAGGSSSDTADLSHSVPALLQLEHVGHWSSHYAVAPHQHGKDRVDTEDTDLLLPMFASRTSSPASLSRVVGPLEIGGRRSNG